MPERVPHDHPSVTTLRAHLARSGGTRKPCLRVPEKADIDDGDVIRLVLDGSQRHARVRSDSQGLLIRGAYDNRRLAREAGAGENRLLEWADDHDRGPGDAVDFDEVEASFLYGLRAPGERAIYDATESPDPSLADIARDLDG